MTHVIINPRDEAEVALWRMASEVAGLFVDWPWVIVGAQMVMLLEFEHGRPTGRSTRDLDVVVDVRVVADAASLAAERLLVAGFQTSSEHQGAAFARLSDA